MTIPPRDEIKLPLTSRDVNAERVAQLRELFPEAFTEGKLDLAKFPQLLGDDATDAPERYGLSWSGKSDAIRAIQITSPGTLRPCVEESWPPMSFAGTESPRGLGVRQPSAALASQVEAASEKRQRAGAVQDAAATAGSATPSNTSENLIIEGDNLETLKLLQGGYHGRVKMIYIDPPYNTGGEFIYPDNYKEGLADYLRFSGQISSEGIKLTTNAETDGRYHSKWLTMMYPRLFLAKNLLREDGVIFVSIANHEVHNLRLVMNEIFGEENFVGLVTWKARVKPVNIGDSKYRPQCETEYVLVYQKSAVEGKFRALMTGGVRAYPHELNGRKYRLTTILKSNRGGSYRSTMSFELEGYVPPEGQRWQAGDDVIRQLNADGYIEFKDGTPFRRYFEDEEGAEHDPFYCFMEVDWSSTSEAGKLELSELIGENHGFDTVKPTRLIETLLQSCTVNDDLILDFFGGSGTTAQAVLELNAQDGGNRKFILVQLPEPTERKDFPTIADITKERVRRVIKKLAEELAAKELKERKEQEGQLPLTERGCVADQPQHGGKSGGVDSSSAVVAGEAAAAGLCHSRAPDLGFKVFKLGGSNFKVWDAASAPKDGAALAEQLKLIAHNVEEGRPDDALLYELVLKSNLPLTSKITAGKIGAQTFYDVADGTLAICLERKITQETLRGLMARQPKGVLGLDIAFAGNDQLKTNTVLEMKAHGIEFHTA